MASNGSLLCKIILKYIRSKCKWNITLFHMLRIMDVNGYIKKLRHTSVTYKLKVLGNPEMAALLTSLAKSMKG